MNVYRLTTTHRFVSGDPSERTIVETPIDPESAWNLAVAEARRNAAKRHALTGRPSEWTVSDEYETVSGVVGADELAGAF